MPNIQPNLWPVALTSALLVLSQGACKAKRLAEELPAAGSHEAAEQNRAADESSQRVPFGEPAPGASGERPSLDQNMGRGFQGMLAMQVRKAGGDTENLRYLSLGNTARLQFDSPPRHFDALIWGESVSLLDHQQRTLETLSLRQIRPTLEPASEVTIQRTGERTSLQGVFCERYVLQDGPLRIDACVSALPGTFDVDKLEAMSGLDVPAWVEQLVKEGLLPLRAHARDAAGKEIYALELVQYSAGPLDPELLAVPSNYRPVEAGPVTLAR